jgi:hypothetical protein
MQVRRVVHSGLLHCNSMAESAESFKTRGAPQLLPERPSLPLPATPIRHPRQRRHQTIGIRVDHRELNITQQCPICAKSIAKGRNKLPRYPRLLPRSFDVPGVLYIGITPSSFMTVSICNSRRVPLTRKIVPKKISVATSNPGMSCWCQYRPSMLRRPSAQLFGILHCAPAAP